MKFEGIIGAPWREVSEGSQIRIVTHLFKLWKEEGNFIFSGPSSLAKWGGTILAVSAEANSTVHIFGTAVLVAPGVAITAAHVIEEFQRMWAVPGTAPGPIICMGLVETGLMLWAVTKMHTVRMGDVITDLCLLELEARTQLPETDGIAEIASAVVTAEIPKPGALVQVLGFRAHSDSFEKVDKTTILNFDLFLSVTKVSDVFIDGQRSFRAPTFIVGCPTVGGQSGGPIFDQDGRLIGILSSGSEQYGRGSIILPALAVPLMPPWPPKFYQNPKCLFEMDSCQIFGKENVFFRSQEETGLFAISPKLSSDSGA